MSVLLHLEWSNINILPVWWPWKLTDSSPILSCSFKQLSAIQKSFLSIWREKHTHNKQSRLVCFQDWHFLSLLNAVFILVFQCYTMHSFYDRLLKWYVFVGANSYLPMRLLHTSKRWENVFCNPCLQLNICKSLSWSIIYCN